MSHPMLDESFENFLFDIFMCVFAGFRGDRAGHGAGYQPDLHPHPYPCRGEPHLPLHEETSHSRWVHFGHHFLFLTFLSLCFCVLFCHVELSVKRYIFHAQFRTAMIWAQTVNRS